MCWLLHTCKRSYPRVTQTVRATLITDIASTVPDQDEPSFLNEVDRRLLSVTEASQVSQMTPSYIRRLLRTNKLPGVKVGRDWFTTEEAIRAYLAEDRRPGPKAKN